MHHLEIVSQLDARHLEQLPGLIEAATLADGHEPLGEHKFLRLCRGDDLAAAVLAFEDGRLAGYAHTVTYGASDARRASCEVVVHPGYRLRGIGRLLISHALMHAHSQAARQLDLWAYNHSDASARIAGQFGFSAARHLLHLHRHVADLPTASGEAMTLRTFRPGVDDGDWLALNNRIFAGHPENGVWTLADLRARMAQPWFEARDLLLLEAAGGGLAGFCWLKIAGRAGEGRVGEIYVIGTAPEQRGRGLGRRLLAHGLAHLAARGAQTAAIYVDRSNEAAVRLYESSGFHHHHVDVCYQRELAPQELRSAA